MEDLAGTEENPAPVYLGIDIGSTTIKAVLLDEEGRILYTSYGASQGDPLSAAVHILEEVYALLPAHARIASAGVTGYGSGLIRAGLRADVDEVETLPLQGSPLLSARSLLRAGYRRPGHQVPAREKRHGGSHPAQ